jgi:hypothetical protein
MAELNLTSAAIVTRGEEERIQVEPGTIDVMPAWRFLLSLPEDASFCATHSVAE